MNSIRLDNIIVEIDVILETINDPNIDWASCDADDTTLIAIKGLKYLKTVLRLKNARIKELQNMFLRD